MNSDLMALCTLTINPEIGDNPLAEVIPNFRSRLDWAMECIFSLFGGLIIH